jgi:hypothetical protein
MGVIADDRRNAIATHPTKLNRLAIDALNGEQKGIGG